MENLEKIVETFETFRWTIKNMSIKLNTKVIYSQNIFIDGYPWWILMSPKGDEVDYLPLFLEVGDDANLPGWIPFFKFKLILVNQLDAKMTRTFETEHAFNSKASNGGWKGWTSFIPLADLYDHSKGFIVNDTCIIEVKIKLDKIVDQAAPPVSEQVPLSLLNMLMIL